MGAKYEGTNYKDEKTKLYLESRKKKKKKVRRHDILFIYLRKKKMHGLPCVFLKIRKIPMFYKQSKTLRVIVNVANN